MNMGDFPQNYWHVKPMDRTATGRMLYRVGIEGRSPPNRSCGQRHGSLAGLFSVLSFLPQC